MKERLLPGESGDAGVSWVYYGSKERAQAATGGFAGCHAGNYITEDAPLGTPQLFTVCMTSWVSPLSSRESERHGLF